MKNSLLWMTLFACGFTTCLAATAESQPRSPDPKAEGAAKTSTGQHAAEAAIREAASAFAAEFNRGDAKALAARFTADGVYVNEDGQRFEGRASIQEEYEALFAITTNVRMHIEIDSIQLINSTTAVEEGRSALKPQPAGANRVMSAYTAVHTLQDGKWLMANVRDTRVELPPDHGQLADLAWLVGTWVGESTDARVEVKTRWIENDHFLARAHSVTESGQVTSSGLEIVGVDPSTGQITSWSFNNDGGHAVGVWVPDDSGWMIDSVGILGDGTRTSAVNSLSRQENDTVLWKSVDRYMGDQLLPDTIEVTLERK